MTEIQSWIPSIVSMVSGIVVIGIAFGVTKTRVDSLEKDKIDLKLGLANIQTHLELASKELRDTVTNIAVVSREQTIINRVTMTTMEALTKRLEDHDKQLGHLTSTVMLLTELVKRLEMLRENK